MKTCNECDETKPITEFYTDARRRDGLRARCKSCTNISAAKYRADNRDKENARTTKWRAENLDRSRASIAKWQAANPERMRAAVDKWQAANPEACRIFRHNRRARERAAAGKLSQGLAERLHKLQRGKCACGCKQPLGTNYHRDHIMPLALGGTNTDDNIQLLRSTCNLQKNAKHPIEFMQSRGLLL